MVEQAAFLGSASLETSGFSVNRARMWQAELGGGGLWGGAGDLVLAGACPCCSPCPPSCRSKSISAWTIAAESSRTWMEPWVSSSTASGWGRRGKRDVGS